MNSVILAIFLARMAGGYALALGLVGHLVKEGSWRRVSLFVIAGLSIVAAIAGGPLAPCVATLVAAVILERGITFNTPLLRHVALIAPFGCWLVVASELPRNMLHFNSALSAIAAGGTLGTMLLGHSYLTARKLSFTPLKWMSLLLLGVIVIRTAFVVPALFQDNLEMMDWVLLSMRIAFGLFLPLLFGWMVWQCARIESNQSATGILYAMTVGVFIGEIIAVYFQTQGIQA